MSTVLVRFAGDTANLERAMAKLAAEADAMGVQMETSVKKAGMTYEQVMKKNAAYNDQILASMGGAIKKFGEASGLAFAAAGVASVVMATKFQQSMELLHTQAGVAQDQVQSLTSDVLALAPQVGTGPDALAQALFHVESTLSQTLPAAERTKQAMDRLRVAAMGAKVGNSDLVDTTNALNAVMASQISGTENMSAAMGALNATVGSGDMHMQDLADAMGSGMLAVVKTFGVTLNDVGAALATFGDNNIRGADAATALVQAVRAFGVPVKGGAKALADLGLSSDQLAKDMASGGLNKALSDLVDHLHKAGVKSTDAGALLTTAFGKKAGNGIAVLVDQFARFQSKVDEVNKGAGTFGDAWAQTTKTLAFQVSQLTTQLKVWADELGLKLIPYIQQAIDWGRQHETLLRNLAIAFGIVAAAAAAFWIASFAPAAAAVAAVTGIVYALEMAYQKWAWFRDAVTVVWDQIKLAVTGAIAVLKVDWEIWSTAFRVAWETIIQPTLKAFASTFLVAAAEIVNGAAKALGWVPGVGPKLKAAAADFDQFAVDVNGALGNIQGYKHITVQADLIIGSRQSDTITNMSAGKVSGAVASAKAAMAAAGAQVAKAFNSGSSAVIGGGGGGGSKSNTLADQLKTAVDTAVKKVQDLKKQMADAGAQIADSVTKSMGGIFAAWSSDSSQNTGAGIAQRFGDQVRQMREFASKITALKKMGLNGATLSEIVNAGVDKGAQMSDVLLGNKAAVSSINSSESAIQAAAGTVGSTMAAGQYDAQILAAIKELVALQKQTPAQYAKALQSAAAAAQVRARTVTG